MATRIKRIQETLGFTGVTSATVTLSEQPSTTGDIITRVLLSRIVLYNLTASQQLGLVVSVSGTNRIVASATFNLNSGQTTVTFSGSDASSYVAFAAGTTGTTVSYAPQVNLSFSGSGTIPTNSNFGGGSGGWWNIPSSFYTIPGETVTLTLTSYTSGSTTCQAAVTLVCIGEY